MTAPAPAGTRSRLPNGVPATLLRELAPAGLLPVLALGATGLATAGYQIEPGAQAATLALTLLAVATLAPLAALRAARPVVPLAALLSGVSLVALPHLGVLRLATVLPLLALATAVAAARALDPATGALSPLAAVAVALAAQLATRGERLWLAPVEPATWLTLAVVPALVGLALAAAGARGERAAARATAVALALFAAEGGWGPGAPFALAALAVAERWPRLDGRLRPAIAGAVAAPLLFLSGEPAWLALALLAVAFLASAPEAGVARPARALLLAVATLSAVASALPWRRAAPAADALAAFAAAWPSTVARPIEARPVVLTADAPRFEAALSGDEVVAWTADSYLVRSAELPCGETLVRVRLDGAAAGELRVGRDSAEWAAERPDVAATLACRPPEPWSSWFPAAGRFLGHHYRGRGRAAAPIAARTIVVERSPELPPETAVALFHLALER